MSKKPKLTNDTEKKTPEAPNNSSIRWWKKRWFIIGAAASLVIIAGLAAYFLLGDQTTEEDSPSEEELSYAEELESYSLPEGADQDWINSDRLTLAGAYHEEDNNQRALSLLGEISNPSQEIIASINTLYMDIYVATGQTDEAAEYALKVIKEKEDEYLELAKTDPTGDYELGKLHEIAGNTRKAIEHYGYVADALDKPQEAMESWETAILEKANQGLDRLNT